MEEIREEEFDKKVKYTLRVELIHGKVLLYNISTDTKKYLIRRLLDNADGDDNNELISFVGFAIYKERYVLINVSEILRITFCFDYLVMLPEPDRYYDNFGIIGEEDQNAEEITQDNVDWKTLSDDDFLPQATIYHKGNSLIPSLYYTNPLSYSSLNEGCLSGLDMELDGELPLRQFINLIDEDGEETFIPLSQIIVMEVESSLIFSFEEEES